MALRGVIIGSLTQRTTYYRPVLYWTATQNIENNTSTVRFYSYIDDYPTAYDGTPYSPPMDWNGTCSSYQITFDGQQITYGNFNSDSDSGWTYTGYTANPYNDLSYGAYRTELIPTAWTSYHEFTVSHNTDGTKSASVSHTYSLNSSGYGPGNVSFSGTITLDTIPRASQPSLSAGSTPLGNSVTIYTNRASGSFTHTITYAFGSASDTIATSVGDSTSWTIPKALANQIPSATSGVGTIYCYTYSGGTHIGTKTVNFTATVPDTAEFKPTFSSITNSELTTSPNIATIVGKYVQGLSNIRLTITGAAGAYGSSISSYNISYNGSNYGASTIDTGIINWSGDKSITGTVTDSRGRTYSNSGSPLTINALAYGVPVISTFTIERCNSGGTLDPLGEYVKVVRAGTASSLVNSTEKNTIAAKVYYKDRAGVSPASYTEITNMTVAATSTLSAVNNTPIVSATGICLATKSYDFKLEITDKFYTTTSLQVLSTGQVIMSWGQSSVGIGKFADSTYALDVAGKINSSQGFYEGGVKLPSPSSTVYSYSSGTLIDLFPTELNQMIVIRVIGNSYGTGAPIDTTIQAYHYTPAGTWYNYSQINNGAYLAPAKFFLDGGEVKCWIKQNSDYQTFIIDCYKHGGVKFQPVSITNAVEPTGSYKVTCGLYIGWNSGNDGHTSGLDADTLEGYHGSQSASAYTVPLRDANGYIYNNYFNSSAGGETSGASHYWYQTGDGFFRPKPLANVKSEIVTSAAVNSAMYPALIQTGTFTSTTANTFLTVTFAYAFPAAPRVFTETMNGTAGTGYTGRIGTITASNFQCALSTSGITVQYIAVYGFG